MNQVNSRVHLACLELRHLAVWRYSMFLWSVHTMNGCSTLSSQYLHSAKHHLHREKLPIPHIVDPPCGIEAVGEEGAGIHLKVQGRTLGEDSPHFDIRSIGLHHELKGRVRMNQGRSSGEVVFEVLGCSVSSKDPREWNLGRGECRQDGR